MLQSSPWRTQERQHAESVQLLWWRQASSSAHATRVTQRTSELRLWGAQRGSSVRGGIWAALLVQLDKLGVILRGAPVSSEQARGESQRTGLRVVPSPKSSFDAAKPRSSGGGGGGCASDGGARCKLAATPLLGGASGGGGGGADIV